MKHILTVLVFYILSISINAQKAGDTLYVAIPKGLTIYSSPNDQSQKLDTIPFGGNIILGEDYKTSSTYKVKELDPRCVIRDSFYTSGYWIKVNWKNIKGYIFDGYLLRIPPFDKNFVGNDTTLKNFVKIEDRYLRKIFKPKEKAVLSTWANWGAPNIIDEYTQEYENGASYKFGMDPTGHHNAEIKLPSFSLQEGYLILKSLMEYYHERGYKNYLYWSPGGLNYKYWVENQVDDRLSFCKDGNYEAITTEYGSKYEVKIVDNVLHIYTNTYSYPYF